MMLLRYPRMTRRWMRKVKFILLKSVGDAYIDRDITDDQMRRALEGVIR